MIIIVIQNIILDNKNNYSLKRIFAVFLKIFFSLLFILKNRLCYKHLFLYFINRCELKYFNVSIITSHILHISNN